MYMIYSPDEAFLKQDLKNSDFLSQIDQLILKNNYNMDTISLTLNTDIARIFDQELLTWGQLDVSPIDET
jgi:phenylalanyl-tRNA synthetase alpha subunit